jgi:hypothetical protein
VAGPGELGGRGGSDGPSCTSDEDSHGAEARTPTRPVEALTRHSSVRRR